MKKHLLILAIASTISTSAIASGIPTVDIVGNLQDLQHGLAQAGQWAKEARQFQDQIQQARNQFNEIKAQGQSYKSMVHGSWAGVADTLLDPEMLAFMPQDVQSIVSSVQNIHSDAIDIKNSFGLSSAYAPTDTLYNTESNRLADLQNMYDARQKSTSKLTSLKAKLARADTPFKKADLQIAISIEVANLANQQMQQTVYLQLNKQAAEMKQRQLNNIEMKKFSSSYNADPAAVVRTINNLVANL